MSERDDLRACERCSDGRVYHAVAHAAWHNDIDMRAERLGVTSEFMEGLIDALPYSKMPEASDAQDVVEWLRGQGWVQR